MQVELPQDARVCYLTHCSFIKNPSALPRLSLSCALVPFRLFSFSPLQYPLMNIAGY